MRAEAMATIAVAVTLQLAAPGMPSAASAVDSAARCEAGKNKVVANYLACRHKAFARAVQRGSEPDFARCDTSFTRKWDAVERKGGASCPTVGDGIAFKAMLDQSTTASARLLAGPTGDGLLFAGYRWNIKQSSVPVGPGPNRFSGREQDVWVDADGLHLSIAFANGFWWSTEVVLDASLGYGTYVFHSDSRVDTLDANAVLGLFTWDDDAPPNYREIDFEFTRWGNPADPTNAQFVVQPYDRPGNLVRYTVELTDQARALTHVLIWSPGSVEMATYKGHHLPGELPTQERIHAWSNTGPDVPEPGAENVRMNLWLVWGDPPLAGLPQEVVIHNFLFVP